MSRSGGNASHVLAPSPPPSQSQWHSRTRSYPGPIGMAKRCEKQASGPGAHTHTRTTGAHINIICRAKRFDSGHSRRRAVTSRRFVRKLSAQLALELVSTVVLLAGVALSCGSRTANSAQLGISHTYTYTHKQCLRALIQIVRG